MNKKDFDVYYSRFADDMRRLISRKQHDYSTESDVFCNLKSVETLGICSVETGVLTRMMDKMGRLSNLIKDRNPLCDDESLRDTLLDLANYSVLLSAYLDYDGDSFKKGFEEFLDKGENVASPEEVANFIESFGL